MSDVSTPAPNAPAASAPKTASEIAARLSAMREPGPAPDAPSASPAPDAPKPSPGEATKLSQTLAKLSAKEREALDHKAASEKHAARVAELEAKIGELDTKDINKLLQRSGLTPEKLGEMFMNGELVKAFESTTDAPKAPELPADVLEAVEYANRKRQEEARTAADREANEKRASDLNTISEAMAPLADQFPLTSVMPKANEYLLNVILQHAEANDGEVLDLSTAMEKMETAVTSELEALISNESTKKWLLGKLGLQAAPVAKLPTKPTTLSNRNSAATPSTVPKSSNSAELAAKLRNMRDGQT